MASYAYIAPTGDGGLGRGLLVDTSTVTIDGRSAPIPTGHRPEVDRIAAAIVRLGYRPARGTVSASIGYEPFDGGVYVAVEPLAT